MKKKLFKLIAVLLALAPMAFAAACSQPNNSAAGGDPSDIVEEQPGEENPSEENPSEENPSEENPSEENPSEENPSEENPSEENPSEENPSEENPSEEEKPTKPSLPGGLVDGGNFQGNV